MADARYDRDFLAWTEDQAACLARGVRAGNRLDYPNLAEEIASLGRQEKRAFESRLAQVVAHLLKLAHSPSEDPKPHWRVEVRDQRRALRDLLDASPSLRARADVDRALENGWAKACDSLSEIDGLSPADLPPKPSLTLDEILGEGD